jgi:hypothetical protein
MALRLLTPPLTPPVAPVVPTLRSADLAAASAELIDRRNPQPFGLYVFGNDHPGAAVARAIEQSVFAEAFGNSSELLDEEYRAYDDTSFFFCVLDHKRQTAAGAMRVILPSGAGLKSLDDIEGTWGRAGSELALQAGVRLGVDRVWDIATLAVAPEYRRGTTKGFVSFALYQAVTAAAHRYRVDWVAAILDVAVLRLIQSQTGRPFSYYPDIEAARYLDSPLSLPVYSDVPAWTGRLRETDPTMYATMIEGRGLEAAMAPPDWASLTRFVDRVSDTGAMHPAGR